MKKIFSATLASSLLLLTGSIAGAQTARARIADTPIRGEANLASPVIATLNEGGPVDVVDLQGDWCRVLVPNEHGKPQVGYVLARLIDIVNTDESTPSIAAPTTNRAPRPAAQGVQIPPTLSPLPQRVKAAKREQALKAEVDALQAEVDALQNHQPVNPMPSEQIPQPAAHHSQAREGFWFNGGLGFGAATCDGCDFNVNGASGGLSLGRTINDRLLLGVGTTGYHRSILGSALNIGTLDARLRFYPVRTSGFFLTGGMGLGSVSFDSETAYGVGVVLGLGWDIRVGSNVSLTPFWNGIGIGTSNGTTSVGQLGLGITVH